MELKIVKIDHQDKKQPHWSIQYKSNDETTYINVLSYEDKRKDAVKEANAKIQQEFDVIE